MRLVRTTAIVITVMTAAFLLGSIPPAQGAPSADGLNNPSFEGGFTKSTVDPDWNNVPNGWTPWFSSGGSVSCSAENKVPYSKPHIEDELDPNYVKDGSASARQWVSYGIMNSGFYQTVTATAGSTYQFAAWGYLWAPEKAIKGTASDANMSFQVGIDPGGGTNGEAGSVTWSAGTQTMDAFTQQSVSATATGGKITVFLRATAFWCVSRNDVHFDTTTLNVTATGPAPGATAAPGAKPTKAPSGEWGCKVGCITTVTPGPDGSVIHTVGPGQTCIGIATAYSVDYDTFLKLNNLTNATCRFISVGVKLTIKPPGGGDAAPTKKPGKNATPAATDAPTEAPVTPTPEVQTGTVCVLGYEDKNGNGLREPTESNLAGMTFTVTGPGGPVANHTTDTSPTPYCFSQLPAGNYTINWEGEGLTPSPEGSQSWPVTVTSGSSASHNFGASTSGGGITPTKTPAEQDGPGLPTWAIALIGAFGVILFMGGLGVAGYFLLLRRTNI